MNLRNEKHKLGRQLILHEARQLFIALGYHQFSMRQLAKAVGCSPGTIYVHFKDKNELVNCLIEDAFDKLSETLHALEPQDDPSDQLKHALRAYIDFGLEHPNHYHFAFLMKDPRPAGTPYAPHAAFDFLRDLTKSNIQSKRLRLNDIDMVSQVLWTAIHGITSLLITKPRFPWVNKDQLINELIETAISGLNREESAQEKT